jgi:hypothetical protein
MLRSLEQVFGIKASRALEGEVGMRSTTGGEFAHRIAP